MKFIEKILLSLRGSRSVIPTENLNPIISQEENTGITMQPQDQYEMPELEENLGIFSVTFPDMPGITSACPAPQKKALEELKKRFSRETENLVQRQAFDRKIAKNFTNAKKSIETIEASLPDNMLQPLTAFQEKMMQEALEGMRNALRTMNIIPRNTNDNLAHLENIYLSNSIPGKAGEILFGNALHILKNDSLRGNMHEYGAILQETAKNFDDAFCKNNVNPPERLQMWTQLSALIKERSGTANPDDALFLSTLSKFALKNINDLTSSLSTGPHIPKALDDLRNLFQPALSTQNNDPSLEAILGKTALALAKRMPERYQIPKHVNLVWMTGVEYRGHIRPVNNAIKALSDENFVKYLSSNIRNLHGSSAASLKQFLTKTNLPDYTEILKNHPLDQEFFPKILMHLIKNEDHTLRILTDVPAWLEDNINSLHYFSQDDRRRIDIDHWTTLFQKDNLENFPNVPWSKLHGLIVHTLSGNKCIPQVASDYLRVASLIDRPGYYFDVDGFSTSQLPDNLFAPYGILLQKHAINMLATSPDRGAAIAGLENMINAKYKAKMENHLVLPFSDLQEGIISFFGNESKSLLPPSLETIEDAVEMRFETKLEWLSLPTGFLRRTASEPALREMGISVNSVPKNKGKASIGSR